MYTSTVLLAVEEFVPMTGVFGQSPALMANISPPRDTSALPAPQPVFTGDGETIIVTVPNKYAGTVEITYQLPDPRYVLLGLAFKGANGGVGRVEFRSVSIKRDVYGSQMTVADACLDRYNGVEFTYVILVQEVATGNIGLIDPGIENESGD